MLIYLKFVLFCSIQKCQYCVEYYVYSHITVTLAVSTDYVLRLRSLAPAIPHPAQVEFVKIVPNTTQKHSPGDRKAPPSDDDKRIRFIGRKSITPENVTVGGARCTL